MQQKIGMQRDLARFQAVVDEVTVLLDILDRLIQDVVLFRVAGAKRHRAEVVRARHESHAGILDVGVIDGQPDRDRLGWSQRPVTGILMPGNALSVLRHLAEEVRTPADNVFADQIADTRNDARVRQNVPDLAIFQMSGTDRVTVATFRNDFCEQVVEILTNAGDFGIGIDTNALDVTVTIEVFNLFLGQHAEADSFETG